MQLTSIAEYRIENATVDFNPHIALTHGSPVLKVRTGDDVFTFFRDGDVKRNGKHWEHVTFANQCISAEDANAYLAQARESGRLAGGLFGLSVALLVAAVGAVVIARRHERDVEKRIKHIASQVAKPRPDAGPFR